MGDETIDRITDEHFQIENRPATGPLSRFVDRFWSVRWALPAGMVHEQRVLPHPGVMIMVDGPSASVKGVPTKVSVLRLLGSGAMFGVLFRPAGFRPFLGRALSSINDRTLALTEIFPEADADVASASAIDVDRAIELFEGLLVARAPVDRQESEATTDAAEYARDNRQTVRVDELAGRAGVSVRHLQRRFRDDVGISPKALIRRYRLQDIVERARADELDWAAVAAEFSYADQSHLTRDFAAVLGVPPGHFRRETAGAYDCADTRVRFRRG